MRRTSTVIALALSVLASACSVSTPRNGTTVAAGAGGVAATAGDGGSPGDAGAAGATGAGAATTDASVGAAGTAPGGASSGTAEATGAGGRATTAGGSAASSTTAAASAAGSAVGVTGDSIAISVMAGFSGPYGGLFKAWADNAFGLWAAEANGHGGINGRKLVLKQVDNRDTAEGGVAACKQVQGNGSFIAISMAGLGGADMSATDCLDKAGIPVVAFNLAGYRDGWKRVVSANDDAKQAVSIASLIKDVIGDGRGKTGMIVVGDPIQFAARDAISKELARLGISHVHDETVSPNQGSFVAELSRLRSAGATTVVMDTGNESIGIVRDADAIGYHPHFTGLFWTLDEFSQAAGALWKDIKAVRVFPTTESPAYAEYKQKARQYGYDSVSGTTVMAYYGGGLLISDILTRAGRALGRDAFVRAAGQLGEYDNGILALTFAPGRLLADVKDFPVVCCNGDNTWKGLGSPRLAF